MSIFRELKNVKEWDQWDTQFRADVSTRGLSSVIDSNFRPQTFKDKVLFHEQQQYLYAVFVRILKTDEGKAIARKYKSTFDAQSIYRELQEYTINSTQAVIDSNTLLQYITTASIVDGSWNGMTEQFVLHWMEQVCLYQDLVDPTAVLVDAVKVSLISDAVRGHPKLSGVYNVAAQLASQPGQHVDYDQYVNLLLSECAQVDSAIARSPRKAVKCSAVKCSVYMSDLAINDGGDDALQFSGENEADYNIDSDPMTLMANAHRRRELSANRVLMHSEQWKGMSPNGQEIWDQYSDEDKAVVLSKPATVVMRPNQPSDLDWDPATFNHEFGDNDDEWDDPVMDHRDLFDKVGNYRNRQGVDTGEVHSSRQIEVTISRLHFQARQVRPGEQDWETLCRLFGWAKHYKDAYGVS